MRGNVNGSPPLDSGHVNQAPAPSRDALGHKFSDGQ